MRGRKESGSWDDSEEGGRASEEKERERGSEEEDGEEGGREVVRKWVERNEGEMQ